MLGDCYLVFLLFDWLLPEQADLLLVFLHESCNPCMGGFFRIILLSSQIKGCLSMRSEYFGPFWTQPGRIILHVKVLEIENVCIMTQISEI